MLGTDHRRIGFEMGHLQPVRDERKLQTMTDPDPNVPSSDPWGTPASPPNPPAYPQTPHTPPTAAPWSAAGPPSGPSSGYGPYGGAPGAPGRRHKVRPLTNSRARPAPPSGLLRRHRPRRQPTPRPGPPRDRPQARPRGTVRMVGHLEPRALAVSRRLCTASTAVTRCRL